MGLYTEKQRELLKEYNASRLALAKALPGYVAITEFLNNWKRCSVPKRDFDVILRAAGAMQVNVHLGVGDNLKKDFALVVETLEDMFEATHYHYDYSMDTSHSLYGKAKLGYAYIAIYANIEDAACRQVRVPMDPSAEPHFRVKYICD